MIRVLSALLLTLVLAVTSVTQAVARGQSAGVTEMVICSNGAAVSVMVDAAGNPVDPVHHCPDCLVALDAPRAPLPAPAPVPALLAEIVPVLAGDAAPVRLVLAAAPRGPPVLS